MAELIPAEADRVRAQLAGLPRRISAVVAELPVGTLLTLEHQRAFADRRPRSVALRDLNRHLAEIERRTARSTVVAAALIRDGRVLVACRNHPAELAGRWEFPGGKVERGETNAAALIREMTEELGATVEVGAALAVHGLPGDGRLVLLRASLAPGSAPPRALEHRELRWLSGSELPGLDWVGTNGQFVTDVTAWL